MKHMKKKIFFLCLILYLGVIHISNAASQKKDPLDLHMQQIFPCSQFVNTITSDEVKRRENIGKKKYNETISFVNKTDTEDIQTYFFFLNDSPKLAFCTGFIKNFSEMLKNFNQSENFDALFDFANAIVGEVFQISDSEFESLKDLQKKFLSGGIPKSEFSREHDKAFKKAINNFLEKAKSRVDSSVKNYKIELDNAHKKFVTEQRQRAKEDVVAQVLNYASGFEEDSTGMMFWYPSKFVKDGCYYRLAIDKSHQKAILFLSNLDAERQLNTFGVKRPIMKEINSIFSGGLNLNSGNFQTVRFSKSFGVKSLDFFDQNNYTKFHSQIEGLPSVFECESDRCSVDRLRRGWTLVSEKCKGEEKPF